MEKLLKKYIIKGTIKAETGIRIGGSSNAMSIGGIDNTIIRDPLTNLPYIPGSSLKGKMRSLLELSYGYIIQDGDKKGESEHNRNYITSRLFGMATNKEKRFSRLIVRDSKLIESSIDLKKTELPYSEVKYENSINRITAKANPRPVERVPAGAEFNLEMVLSIFESDKEFDNNDDKYPNEEERLLGNIFYGLGLLQDDYLGGYGSRGSGKVRFNISKVFLREMSFYQEERNDNEDNLITNEPVSKYVKLVQSATQNS